MPTKSKLPDFDFDEEWIPVERPSSTSEVVGAQFRLGLMNSEVLSMARTAQATFAANDNDIISAKTANELFPTEVPWDRDVSAAEAASVQAHQQEKQRLQEIVSSGENTLTNDVFGFTAGLAGAAIDPIGILSGKALAGLARPVFARAMGKTLLGKPIRRQIIEQSFEGAVGNLATEVALIMPSQDFAQEDFDTTNQLMFAMAGGALFPAAVGSIKGAYRGLTKLSEKAANRAFDLTEQRMLADKNPNLSTKELELLSNETGTQLRTDLADIQSRIEQSEADLKATTTKAESDKITKRLNAEKDEFIVKSDEIRQYMEDFTDGEAIRRDSNSDANNIYHSPQAADRLQRIDEEPDIDPTKIVEEEFNIGDDADPVVRETVEAIEKQFAPVEANIETIQKAVLKCARS